MWFANDAWEEMDWERCLQRDGAAKLYVAKNVGLNTILEMAFIEVFGDLRAELRGYSVCCACAWEDE